MVASKYTSIQIAQFLMKAIGFWIAETRFEWWFLHGVLTYTFVAVGIAILVEFTDFYYSWGNFYAITYTACSTMPVVIVLLKISLFVMNREEMMKMIKYTQRNIWYREYDDYGVRVLENIDSKGLILISSFTICITGTVITFTCTPIVENIGRNETDRILPFKLWIDFIPTTTTPYFEIIFVIQTLSLIHTAICFACFDNFLCILCMHAAGQFKILQNKFTLVKSPKRIIDPETPSKSYTVYVDDYEEFKRCVVQYQTLINYVAWLERLFTYSTLCQMLISSVLLCVAGFQIFMAQETLVRRMIFVTLTFGCLLQLFVITVTANEVIIESGEVGNAAYNMDWQSSDYEDNVNIRSGVVMVLARANRPCCITAGGFFPVSLETFMTVLSTAGSYFMVLRNFLEEQDGQ